MLDKKATATSEIIPYAPGTVATAAQIRIVVDGRTPLLTHNPESMGTTLEAGKGTRIPEAEVEAEAGCYRLSDGTLGIKGESFRASLLGAAGAWKAKRSTMKSRLSHVTVVEEMVALLHLDGSPIRDYVIDARRAIVQKQGIIRRRPRFDEWSCKFTFEFDPILVSDPKLIVDILADAGGRIGVGDYRPSRNGWFGRFTVRNYQLLD
jgi:hypothetical protein